MRNFQVKSKTNELKKKRRDREGGFTLIEILIALSIFSVGILAVAAMQIRSMQVNTLASNITESTTWTQDKMEELISRPWAHADLSAAGNPHTETAQDGTLVTWNVTDATVGGAAAANLKNITVRATYRDGLGNTKTSIITGSYPLVAVD